MDSILLVKNNNCKRSEGQATKRFDSSEELESDCVCDGGIKDGVCLPSR
jgi:hypothetical protein